MGARAKDGQSGQNDRERAQRLETLLGELAELPEPYQSQATQLVQALLELYGEGLARIVASTARKGTVGDALIAEWARDELVGPLLVLHELHPDSQEARVRAALDALRPDLQAQGASAELLGVAEGVARVRLTRLASSAAGCQSCGSAAQPVERLVEEAVYAAAPDLAGVHVEGGSEPQPTLITLTPRRNPVAIQPSADASG